MTHSDEELRTVSAEPAVLWVVSVPRTLEERMIDWLLARDDILTFTTTAVDVHGIDPAALVGPERVSARRRKTEFRVRIAAAQLDEMTAALEGELAGADVSWVALPIAAASPAQ